MRQDIQFALRSLRKKPGFTAVVVAMLALGIGVNAAVFTIVNAALFTGWPLVQHNDRVVQISTNKNFVYYPDFEQWRSQAKSFDQIALIRGVFLTMGDGSANPETHFTTQVTANTFAMLGVKPMLGRDFQLADEQPGAEPVVILRYKVWATQFGANPAIVGQIVRLDGQPTRVIGVMPEGFFFPYPMNEDLWVPLIPTPAALRRETGIARYAAARLADGVSLEQARAEMSTIGGRLASEYPRTNQDLAPTVTSFEEWFIGESARTLYKGIWGAVVFVLLIVCANVGNLFAERALTRSREIAIRQALGASRWRIVRQFAVESLTLSAAGGALGWWIAKVAVRIYAVAQVNEDVLRFTMDRRVLLYLISISLMTGLLGSVGISVHATRLSRIGGSKGEGRGIAGSARERRLSGIFVGVEMVLAVGLLASAGVIARSFWNVYSADLGINASHVLMMAVGNFEGKYAKPEANVALYRELGARLRALPGVESVGFGTAAPGDQVQPVPYELASAPIPNDQPRPSVTRIIVSEGYFQTVGARVVSGRGFGDSDRMSSLPVAIVNQEFANRNWPGQNPLGKRLRVLSTIRAQASPPWLNVVGVVSNIAQNDRTRQRMDPLVYLSDEQFPGDGFAFVRTTSAAAGIAAAMRRAVYAIDPALPVSNLMPLSERLDRAYGFERNIAGLFLCFAVVALLLASAGLYTAVSHSVSRRIQEIGIRRAIGATDRDLVRLVFRQGAFPVGGGLALGLALSFAMNRVLKSQLVGVSAADPATLAGASLVLVLAAALGCWLPARRAMRVDPAIALKHE